MTTRKNIYGKCACYKLEYASPLFSAIAHNVKKSFAFKDWWVLQPAVPK
jgi:hypothetical protein